MLRGCIFNQSVRLFVEVKIFVTFRFSKNESILRLKGIREDEEKSVRGRLDVDEEESQ